MTNFNRFRPIGWEEQRSKSFNSRVLNNSQQVESASPMKEESTANVTVNDKSVQSVQRRHQVNNRIYLIEISKHQQPQEPRTTFEIKATDEISKKVFRIELNALNANRMFSLYKYDLDNMI